MRIGPYEILGELGRGGMGVVYRARDADLGREVAIKLMLDRSPPGEATERFIREVRLSAQAAGHPGIAKVHHAGALPDGRLYYVMELVPGRSLQALISEGPMPPLAAARYIALAAEAVHHAHGRGVIHRDLSPKNIIIDAQDLPRILDFGLAKPVGDATRLTATGVLVGTPVYMAPEQMDGSEEVSTATDVYGLGACLYACLTGRAPYSEASVYKVIAQVVQEARPGIATVNPAAPPALCAVVDRAMARHPGDRYPSAQDLANDLRAFARGEAVSARPLRRSRGGRARRVAPLAAGAALLMALAAVFAFGGGGPGPPAVRPDPLPRPSPSLVADDVAAREVRSLIDGAIAALRDADRVGSHGSLAFRSLLPARPAREGDPRDPANPLTLWAAAERERLRSALDGSLDRRREEERVRAAGPLEDLDRARRLAPEEVWPIWAAGQAALGRDGAALAAGGPETAAAALLRARLRIVRGEAEEALAVLDGIEAPEDPALRDEIAILRAIGRILTADIDGARDVLETVTTREAWQEAALPAALVARVDPRVTAGVLDLGNVDVHEPYRQAAERAIRERFRDGVVPPEPAAFLAQVLLEGDRFEDACRLIQETRARYPDDPLAADSHLATRAFCLAAHSGGARLVRRFWSDVWDQAGRAVDALGLTPESIDAEARALLASDPLSPAAQAVCARRRGGLPEEERVALTERAFGLEAVASDLSSQLSDRCLRLLVAGGVAGPDDDRLRVATWLAHLGYEAYPAAHLAVLRSALSTDFPCDVLGAPAPGWVRDDRLWNTALTMLDGSSYRTTLPLPILLALAEGYVEQFDPVAQGDRAELDLHRANSIRSRIFERIPPVRAPEAALLLARLHDGFPDGGDEAVPEARAALAALRENPLIARPAWQFHREAAAILEHRGFSDEAQAEIALAEAIRTLDLGRARQEFAAAWQANSHAGMIEVGTLILAASPDDPGILPILEAVYDATGQPLKAIILEGRALRLGRWERTDELLTEFIESEYRDAAADLFYVAYEGLDGTIGSIVVKVANPRAPPDQVLRGIGLATHLVALGVAPGPLLALCAYGRLRLGDARGALLDAAAAEAAHLPQGYPDAAARDLAARRYARFPRLVAALASALLGDDDAARAALDRIGDRAWLRMVFTEGPRTALPPDLLALRAHRVFEPYLR